MIMVAFIMASKYIHDNLKSIIYTSNRNPSQEMRIDIPITPPTSPKLNINNSTNATIQSISAVVNTTTATDVTTTTTTEKEDQRLTPISSPNSETTTSTNTSNSYATASDKERNLRIARMEQEFLFFLNYDLSVQDPSLLVRWAQSYQVAEKNDLEKLVEEEYTSADEADDEMDDDDDDCEQF
jgi:hypothetical protein